MRDFILDNGADGNIVLTLHKDVRVPRIILPLIAGIIGSAVAAIIWGPAMQNLSNAGAKMAAGFELLVCACFVVIAVASFLQAAIALFGKQAWTASSDCLEFHQEIFGWRLAKRLTGQIIVLTPPATRTSTSWKLVVAKKADAEHIWDQEQIHISSDDDELRTIGQILAGSTGWRFVEQNMA